MRGSLWRRSPERALWNTEHVGEKGDVEPWNPRIRGSATLHPQQGS